MHIKVNNAFNIILVLLVSIVLTGCGVALTESIEVGDRASVIKAINEGANVNQYDQKGRTPLAVAIAKKDTGMIKLLLEKGAKVSSYHVTEAFKAGMWDTVDLLLINGGDVDDALDAAIQSSNMEKIRFYIEQGASVKSGHVSQAANKKQWDMVDYLIDNGGNIDEAYEVAMNMGNTAKANKYFELGARPTNDMMFEAVLARDILLVNTLVKNGYRVKGSTIKSLYPLSSRSRMGSLATAAVWTGEIDILKAVLFAGANPNENASSDPLCSTIDLAIGKLKPDFGDKEKVEMIRLLLAAGANPNLRCDYKRTPLIYAGKKGNYEMVKLLLAAGADPNAKDKYRETALHSLNPNVKSIRALVALGADVNAMDISGNTPLHNAAYDNNAEACKELLLHGADVNAGSGSSTPLDKTIDVDGSISAPAAHRVLKSFGGRADLEEKRQRRKSQDSFGKIFATLAVAGLAGSADISSEDRARVMSATVNDIWVEDGKGTQLGDMYKESLGQNNSVSTGDPVLDDMIATKKEQITASEIFKQHMEEQRKLVQAHQQKQPKTKSLYQQNLERIAKQTGNSNAHNSQVSHATSTVAVNSVTATPVTTVTSVSTVGQPRSARAESKQLEQREASRQEHEKATKRKEEKEFDIVVYEAIAFVYKTKTGKYMGEGPTSKMRLSNSSKENALQNMGCGNHRTSMDWAHGEHQGEIYFCNRPLEVHHRDVANTIGASHMGGQTVFHCQENWSLNWKKYCK